MSVELSMLVYSAALFLVIILVQAGLAIAQNGLMAQAGSRDNLPEPTVLRKRLQRLTANMVSNDTTVMGASLFFYARIAHAIVYAFGWPMIRPLFFFVGLYGIIIIGLETL
jgi:uncharacterized MAPEG superfamily protein